MSLRKNKSYESALIKQIKSGDKDAFAELYQRHYSELCDFVFHYVEAEAICEELVQDLFLKVWNGRNRFNPEFGIKPYLYKAAKNIALDHLRRVKAENKYLKIHKIEREYEWKSQKIKQTEAILQKASSTVLKDQDLSEIVEVAVEQLPERRRIIFLLSREDGLTYSEIASVLDISVKTVETQMGRSLKTLRNVLSEHITSFAFATFILKQIL